jgi:serine protease
MALFRKSLLTLLAPLALAALPATAAAAAPDEVVLRFKGQAHARVIEAGPAGAVATARALRVNRGVAYATPNYVATASALVPNDPGTTPGRRGSRKGWVRRQWNFLPCGSLCGAEALPGVPESLGGIDMINAWRNLRRAGRPGGLGVTVAVLDTGIAHRRARGVRRSPDFRRTRFVRGRDFVDGDPHADDTNGHGTHVAGTIGEQTNNGIGLTGIAFRAKLMPVRVLDQKGKGDSDDIARGIRFAAKHGADVINMSFNFDCRVTVPVVEEALSYAARQGAVLVASSGNLGCVSAPAGIPHVITVGGTTVDGCRGIYSPTSVEIDLLAPGGGAPVPTCGSTTARSIFQVTLKRPGGRKFGIPRNYTGTSMAAAHVSGVAALVISSNVLGAEPDPSQVLSRLQDTARSLGMNRAQQGAGLIDAGAATAPEPPPR